jgi:hypothetical protein
VGDTKANAQENLNIINYTTEYKNFFLKGVSQQWARLQVFGCHSGHQCKMRPSVRIEDINMHGTNEGLHCGTQAMGDT